MNRAGPTGTPGAAGGGNGGLGRAVFGTVLCVLTAVLAYLLWVEHRAHLAGALPYALLLVCVGMHLLMHRQGPRPGSGSGERP